MSIYFRVPERQGEKETEIQRQKWIFTLLYALVLKCLLTAGPAPGLNQEPAKPYDYPLGGGPIP